MTPIDIFESEIRAAGDLAGVFECDSDTGYFYLCRVEGESTEEIVGAIQVLSRVPDFTEADVSIRWNQTEEKVGLFIRGNLWAVFDVSRDRKYGGAYRPGTTPSLPPEAEEGFVSFDA